MAQLSDDCFAFGGSLLPLEEVERLIAARIAPIEGEESVPLGAADNRVLAQDLIAALDLPPFDNTAVDGYAVRHADLAADAPTRLTLFGRVQAGAALGEAAPPRHAVRVFTGAPMPPGTDTVFMQEDVSVEGDSVVLPPGLKPGANRRLAGEDVRRGSVALSAGRRLTPADLAMAAAMGERTLRVRRRLKVAVFSTGNELIRDGVAVGAASIHDANRPLLLALVRRLGAEESDLGIIADEPDQLAALIAEAAKTHDLVLTSGGVSTGEADYVRDAVERIGQLVFWRVAIKPGRPIAMGVVEGAAFAGLPGNPVAAFVTFVRVVRPLLLRLAGATPEPLRALPVQSGFAYRKKSGRREYVRVRLESAGGGFVAHKHAQEGAGVLSSLTLTEGLVELPEDCTAVAPGDTIGFLPYATLIA